MFINKRFPCLICAYLKKYFNEKSSTYYLQMTTKIFAGFQVCISVPLSFESLHQKGDLEITK